MSVQIITTALNPDEILARHQAGIDQEHGSGSYGAVATFVGTMRDSNEGDAVTAMQLEHYPDMTEKQLASIIANARQQWPVVDCLIAHRVGRILPGDPIVLTAVWSKHRAAAFDACRFLMEALKTDATFWKKETLADGRERWVEKNTPGYSEPSGQTEA